MVAHTHHILQRLKTRFTLSSDIASSNAMVPVMRTLSQGKSQVVGIIHASVRTGTDTAVPRTRRIISWK